MSRLEHICKILFGLSFWFVALWAETEGSHLLEHKLEELPLSQRSSNCRSLEYYKKTLGYTFSYWNVPYDNDDDEDRVPGSSSGKWQCYHPSGKFMGYWDGCSCRLPEKGSTTTTPKTSSNSSGSICRSLEDYKNNLGFTFSYWEESASVGKWQCYHPSGKFMGYWDGCTCRLPEKQSTTATTNTICQSWEYYKNLGYTTDYWYWNSGACYLHGTFMGYWDGCTCREQATTTTTTNPWSVQRWTRERTTPTKATTLRSTTPTTWQTMQTMTDSRGGICRSWEYYMNQGYTSSHWIWNWNSVACYLHGRFVGYWDGCSCQEQTTTTTTTNPWSVQGTGTGAAMTLTTSTAAPWILGTTNQAGRTTARITSTRGSVNSAYPFDETTTSAYSGMFQDPLLAVVPAAAESSNGLVIGLVAGGAGLGLLIAAAAAAYFWKSSRGVTVEPSDAEEFEGGRAAGHSEEARASVSSSNWV